MQTAGRKQRETPCQLPKTYLMEPHIVLRGEPVTTRYGHLMLECTKVELHGSNQ